MPQKKKSLGRIILKSIARHAVLALLTGGSGNLIAVAGDAADLFDIYDISDAADVADATDSHYQTVSSYHLGIWFQANDRSVPGFSSSKIWLRCCELKC
jgi:hypothetical protein